MIISDLDSTDCEPHLTTRIEVQHSFLAILELVGEEGFEKFRDQGDGRPPDYYLLALNYENYLILLHAICMMTDMSGHNISIWKMIILSKFTKHKGFSFYINWSRLKKINENV